MLGFINLIRPLVTCLLGLVVYHWLDILHEGPSLLPDRQDQAFPFALATFAPSGLRGVILAGFFAAVMSTVSALSNAVATIFSLDVYRRLWRPHATDAELIATGRLSAAAALVVSGILAPLVANIGAFQVLSDRCHLHGHALYFCLAVGHFLETDELRRGGDGPTGRTLIQILLAFAVWASRTWTALAVCGCPRPAAYHVTDRYGFALH